MDTAFSRRLTMLRKEQQLSQRQAAEQLGISQALLCHYERGNREPGLDFLLHASRVYKVSTDYLLGCSSQRDPSHLSEPFPDEESLKDHPTQTMPSAQLGRRLLINAIYVLVDWIGQWKDTQLTVSSVAFLEQAVSMVCSEVNAHCQGSLNAYFSNSEDRIQEDCATLLLLHGRMCRAMNAVEKSEELFFSETDFREKYPDSSPGFLAVLHHAMTNRTDIHEVASGGIQRRRKRSK
jgi:transcriptional regulator with XRE-family HTH domain